MRSTIGVLTETVLRLAAAEPIDAFEAETLRTEVTELQATLDRLQVELGRRLASFDRRRGYTADGHTSTTAFLRHAGRMSGGRAKKMLAEAHALEAMPVTAELAASGELSLDQTRVLIRARGSAPEAFERDEGMLTEVATGTDFVSHLATAIGHWSQAVAEPSDDNSLFEKRFLHVSRTFEGMVRVDGWLDPAAGEVLLDALDSAMAPPAAGDVRSTAQRRADALLDLVSGRTGSRVPELVVHVGDDRLAGRAETRDGSVLDDRSLDRVACDCTVHRVVFGADSQPVDVGRRYRLVTGPQRKAMVARDRHCRFWGCDRPARWTDAHHIVSWLVGGATDLGNLVLLCRFHHTLVHDGGWSLAGTADDFTIRRPDGSVLARQRRAGREQAA
jgi:hypothetical protein